MPDQRTDLILNRPPFPSPPPLSFHLVRFDSLQVSLETFVPAANGSGGDYHRQNTDHWSELTALCLFILLLSLVSASHYLSLSLSVWPFSDRHNSSSSLLPRSPLLLLRAHSLAWIASLAVIQGNISNPMSQYEEFSHSRTSWGIGVLGSLFVKITASDGTVGYATGFGGPPACWLIEEHFKRFVVGKDPRDTNLIWEQVSFFDQRTVSYFPWRALREPYTDLAVPFISCSLTRQMFRGSMFYGRKGVTMAAISAVDLAIWDLLGKIRKEPVYKMIGGSTKPNIPLYLTGPLPAEAKRMGFWGGKVPLPHGPHEGYEGLRKNVAFLKKHRESVGDEFPLMVDCYMSLNVSYTCELVEVSRVRLLGVVWALVSVSPY